MTFKPIYCFQATNSSKLLNEIHYKCSYKKILNSLWPHDSKAKLSDSKK